MTGQDLLMFGTQRGATATLDPGTVFEKRRTRNSSRRLPLPTPAKDQAHQDRKTLRNWPGRDRNHRVERR